MTLKDLLGDSYKEGITEQEINDALAGRKIVDLKTGNYVDKDKYEKAVARSTELEAQLNNLKESTKDYNDLVNFKKTTEQEKEKADTIQKLKDAGFKDEFMDFALFQVESGKIAKGDDFIANAQKFLSENKQYAKEQEPEKKPQPSPTIDTLLGGAKQPAIEPKAEGRVLSWNKNRS